MDNREIGNYLLQKRKEKGMTQTELASILNVSHQAVSRWERGENLPDVEKLVELASLYEVSLENILGTSVPLKNKNIDKDAGINIQKKHYLLFWISNVFSVFLAYIFSSTGFELFEIMAYLSIIVFMFGANVLYHINFNKIESKGTENVVHYLRGYQLYLLILTIIISLVSTGYILSIFFHPLLFTLIGFTALVESKYEDLIDRRLTDFRNYKVIKIVLVIISIVLYFSLFSNLIVSFYYMDVVIMITVGTIAMIRNK